MEFWFFDGFFKQFSYNCGNTEEIKTHGNQPKYFHSREPGAL